MMGLVLSLLESPVISLPLQLGVTHSGFQVQLDERVASSSGSSSSNRKQSSSSATTASILKIQESLTSAENSSSNNKKHVSRQQTASITNRSYKANANETTVLTSCDKIKVASAAAANSAITQQVKSKQQFSESKVGKLSAEHMSKGGAGEVFLTLNTNNDDDVDIDDEPSTVVNRPMREVNELTGRATTSCYSRDKHCLQKHRVECSQKGDKSGSKHGAAVLNGSVGRRISASSENSSFSSISSSSRRASDQSHALCSETRQQQQQQQLNIKDESVANFSTTQNTGKNKKALLPLLQQQREQKNKDSCFNASDATTADADADADLDAFAACAYAYAASDFCISHSAAQIKAAAAAAAAAAATTAALKLNNNDSKTKTKLKSTNKTLLATSSSPSSSSSQTSIHKSIIVNLSDIDENVPHAKHAHLHNNNHKPTTTINNKTILDDNIKATKQHHYIQKQSTHICDLNNTNNNNNSITTHILSNNSGLDTMRRPSAKKSSLNSAVMEHEALMKQQVHSAHFINQQQPLLMTPQPQQQQQQHNHQYQQKYQPPNTSNTKKNNNNNRQYKYRIKQRNQNPNQKQHQPPRHDQPLSESLSLSQTQFIPSKKFKTHKFSNINISQHSNKNTNNNNNINQNHLIEDGQQRTRDRRSLSTTSSLASSASSSPSSSMLQIYMRDRVNNNNNINTIHPNYNEANGSIKSTPQNNKFTNNNNTNSNNNNNNSHHHHQRQQQQQQQQHGRRNKNHELRDRKQLISSSASSTISSSSSSCDSAQLSPNSLEPEDIVSNLLLYSTANLSINQAQSPPSLHPAYIQQTDPFNQYQKLNNKQNKALWQSNNNNNNNNNNNINININPHQTITTANNHAQFFTFQELKLLIDSPPERPWLEYNNQQQQKNDIINSIRHEKVCFNRESGQEFTVLSYNVLCDRLVNKKAFPTSPDVALNWFYRRELIMSQLREYDADIIALQELEIEHYETYFMVELETNGNYKSIFEPKSRAKTMDSEQQKRVDGCAIFYKTNKFKLVQRHLLEYSLIAMANSRGSEAMLNRVMTKDNIGLVAVLELIDDDDDQIKTDETMMATAKTKEIITQDKEKQISTKTNSILSDNNTIGNADVAALLRSAARKEQQCDLFSSMNNQQHHNHELPPASSVENDARKKRRQIVICNTHIHWDPECCDVKLVQTILLMNELESIAKHHGIKLKQEEIKQQHNDELFNDQIKKSIITKAATATTSGDKLQQTMDDDDDNMLPLILLGDFNSLPDSGVTEFLIGGHINSLHEDFKDHKYSSCSNSVAIPNTVVNTTTGCVESISTVLNYNHPFNLASAYKKDIMPYTNYTPQFKAIIDYIFYSQNSIQLLGVLGALNENWFKGNRIKGLPHVNFPSDHLPLLAKFKLPSSRTTKTKINDELNRC